VLVTGSRRWRHGRWQLLDRGRVDLQRSEVAERRFAQCADDPGVWMIADEGGVGVEEWRALGHEIHEAGSVAIEISVERLVVANDP
jgi:hypothetical protein